MLDPWEEGQRLPAGGAAVTELPVEAPNRGWDPRVRAFTSGSTVTVFAVVTERWTVLVDTLYSEAGARELARLVRPTMIVNTHADWDHAWGNAAFPGLPILGTAECARRLRSPEEAAELARMQAAEPARFAGASLVPPNLTFEGAAEVDGGDLTLRLLRAPGHQPDQIVIWIPEIRTLLGADATEHPMPFVQGPGHLAELVGTLEWMRDLRPATVLACHDRLDGDPRLLDRNLAYFAAVREAARRHPEVASDHPDPEAALGMPFAAAVPEEAREFYRGAHLRALRAALAER